MKSLSKCPRCTARLKGKRLQAPYLEQRIEGSGSLAELVVYCPKCDFEQREPKPKGRRKS